MLWNYYALFHSYIIYCLPIWAISQQKILNKISSLQKQAIRLVCNLQYNAHTEPYFKKLKILPFNDLIKFSNLQIMHKFKQAFLPRALNNVWILNSQRHRQEEDIQVNENARLQLRNHDQLYLPPCRLFSLSKHPYFNLPRAWQDFNMESIKIIRNKNEFNHSLKKHLLELLSDNVTCTRLLCPSCHLTAL